MRYKYLQNYVNNLFNLFFLAEWARNTTISLRFAISHNLHESQLIFPSLVCCGHITNLFPAGERSGIVSLLGRVSVVGSPCAFDSSAAWYVSLLVLIVKPFAFANLKDFKLLLFLML